MNRIFSALALASLMAISVFGQYDRAYGDRDYARQDRGMFDKARMDLDRASAYPYASRSDRKRFDEARGKLFDFESRFDQGRYDKHELSGAIDSIQHVVESNSLDPRDRGAISDDLRRMRDYREFRNHHGGDYGYGYR
ncbi:MAG TPA: hypothetical protein VGL82_18935 [Bryobacteraceae bacterium]|jgi:hypothetical protein